MIKKIEICNFKLFKDSTTVPFSQINLLTGVNGAGKSSVLQVLLILSQSILNNRSATKISLNGRFVNLGNFSDIKNKETISSESITFIFHYSLFSVRFVLRNQEVDDFELELSEINVDGFADDIEFKYTLNSVSGFYDVINELGDNTLDFNLVTSLEDLFISRNFLRTLSTKDIAGLSLVKESLNLNSIHYVSADRRGPKNYYERKTLGQFLTVGAYGEDTVNVLQLMQTEKVSSHLFKICCNYFGLNPAETSKAIEDFTNLWMGEIFQGAKIKVESIKGEDLSKMKISSDHRGDYFKPTNVGYGFSYSLPIIVSGLIAKPGEILIVENPEAHLHPAAQAILATFLAMVSETGVQVFIESHSEHMLNGLRIAVFDKLIQKENLNVLYFGATEVDYFAKIEVDTDGSINNWPGGFFDQGAKDLNHLFGV